VVHVAGISADGNVTVGNEVRSNRFVDSTFGNNDGMAITSNNTITFITGNSTRASISSGGILSYAKLEAGHISSKQEHMFMLELVYLLTLVASPSLMEPIKILPQLDPL
jgi:hypothetical protein